MTKHNAIDASTGDLVKLTKREIDEQTDYLDSLPKDQQIKIAAKACGMTVVELLTQIASLHNDMVAAERGEFDHPGIPCADPIIFEYIEK